MSGIRQMRADAVATAQLRGTSALVEMLVWQQDWLRSLLELPPMTTAEIWEMEIALDQWSRPGVLEPERVEIFGVRPNSPMTRTSVVSSKPR